MPLFARTVYVVAEDKALLGMNIALVPCGETNIVPAIAVPDGPDTVKLELVTLSGLITLLN